MIGKSVSLENLGRFTDGSAAFLGDLVLPGCLEAAFVRSSEAHGVLMQVDTAPARTLDGVVGAFAAYDLPDLPQVPASPGNEMFAEDYVRPALAETRTRYVGEPLAVVIANSRAKASDGALEIFPEIDPLPISSFSTDWEESVSLFEGKSNLVFDVTRGAPTVSPLIDECDVQLEIEETIPRLAHISLEGRGIIVDPTKSPIEVWCSSQAPHRLQQAISSSFDLREHDVRVRVPYVGGAFGLKSHIFPEYIAVAAVALKLGVPIRWIEDRREGLTGGAHGRGQYQRIRIGANRAGQIIAMERDIIGDLGAYPHYGAYVPHFTALVASGPYSVENLSVRVRGLLTNRAPTCPYRGAGRPEAAYVLERAIDELSAELERDPAEVRRLNFIPRDRFPYSSPTGAIYDTGDYATLLDRALELLDYGELRDRQKGGSQANKVMGIGIAAFVERSGGAVGASEYGSVQLDGKDRRVICRSGSMASGQEHGTTFAQIVSDVLEIPARLVHLIEGDTAEIAEGTGSFASRSTQVGGSALYSAAVRVREELIDRASEAFEIDIADLVYSDGEIYPAGSPHLRMSIWDIARDQTLTANDSFSSDQAFPSGVYGAVVEIDPESGEVTVEHLVAVDDCGVVINPRIVHGQVMGSSMQGLGAALSESIVYDSSGQLLTSSLMDYLPPKSTMRPDMQMALVEIPTPVSPLGAKGAGETGCIGVPGAVVNAIQDAIRRIGGAGRIHLPATTERVWTALQHEESS